MRLLRAEERQHDTPNLGGDGEGDGREVARERPSKVEPSGQPDAMRMVGRTLEDLEALTKSLISARDAAEGLGDSVTFNLLDGYIDEMSLTKWMLRATLGS